MYNSNMTQIRKEPLMNGQYYHIYSRSIAKFVVFNNEEEYKRMYQLINLYRNVEFNCSFSHFDRLTERHQNEIINACSKQNDPLVEIVAFCIMPTHIHLVIKQVKDDGISKYMSRVLNGYSRYFNTKHGRTGPLWAGRFKSVLVKHNEQLSHLTRYIHLNPTSAGLVDDVAEWKYSSYFEYIKDSGVEKLCIFKDVIDMNKKQYKDFVSDNINNQKDLAILKYMTIDYYSG